MDFLGAMNLIEGVVEAGEGGARLVSGGLALALAPGAAAGTARYGVRPEHLELAPPGGEAAGPSDLLCAVEEVVFKGPAVSVLLAGPDGRALQASAPAVRVAEVGLARGDRVRVRVPPERLVRLEA